MPSSRHATRTITAIITGIDVEPDRFGRLHPVIAFEDVESRYLIPQTIRLQTLDQLCQHGYDIADIVAITKIGGGIPVLGEISEKGGDGYRRHFPPQFEIALDEELCPHCQTQLLRHHGQFYCTNPQCRRMLLNRLSYAVSPLALNLPFDRDHLMHLASGEHPVALDDLLTADVNCLQCWNIEDAEEIEGALDYCHFRLSRYHLFQARFLDALSIVGLHRLHIRRLLQAMIAGQWHWHDLANVLCDARFLHTIGIPATDALTIAAHAKPRYIEIRWCGMLSNRYRL